MKVTALILGALCLVAVTGGCGVRIDPTAPDDGAPATGIKGLLASGATLDSAFLEMCVRRPGGEKVIVHPVDQPWLESSVTWNHVGPWVSPFVIATFAATDSGTVRVNVSALVNGWIVGTRVNNGIMLDQNPPYIERTQFDSRERGATCPRLKLYFSGPDGGTVWTLRAVGDAYIDENRPDANMGYDSALYSGYEIGMPGEERTLLAFDLVEPVAYATIGDRVWDDADGNGVQDAGESGVPDVIVNLYDCFGTFVATAVTAGDGSYLFDSLASGAYRVEFIAPAGFVFSPRGAGSDSTLDSDADPLTGIIDCFAAMEGSVDLDRDAGLHLQATLEPGCTHGLGWWKNRTGFGKQPDEVSALLPLWLGTPGGAKSIAVTTGDDVHNVLGMLVYGHPSNGVTKLYARLLVARLNIASGAAGDDIQDVIDEVDLFLASTDWHDWDGLDKDARKEIVRWRAALQRYSGGEIGPGSCDGASGD